MSGLSGQHCWETSPRSAALGLGAASLASLRALVKSEKCGVLGAILISTLLSSVPQILEALSPALLLCSTGGTPTSVTSLLRFLELSLKVISGEASDSVGSRVEVGSHQRQS